jgi:hypothetical protein
VSDTKVKHVFGKNATAGPTIDDIWTVDGLYVWQTNTFTVEAISTSANDTTNGTGARSVKIVGLDANWDEYEETIFLAGTSATSTTGSFIRINEALVATSGTYASNTITGTQAGDISIRITGGGADQCEILNTLKYGHSQVARYSVPNNKTAYIRRISANVDGNKAADIFFWERLDGDTVTAPFSPKIILVELDGVLGEEIIPFDVPLKLPSKTDFWVSADTASGTTLVDVELEIIVVDD